MTVCDLCKGTGRLLKPWYDTTGLMTGFTGDICFMCDGKGKVDEPQTKKPNTNFDRITESPEALAEFIDSVLNCCNDEFGACKHCPLDKNCISNKGFKQIALEWLKQESE